MTKAEFLKLEPKERRKYLSNMSKKQLQKVCKAYGIEIHGGAFAMSAALVNLK